MIWTGTHHAPGNSTSIQTIARALPEQEIRIYADSTHLAELQSDPSLTALSQVSFRPITVSRHFRFKTHVVSLRRGIHECATMWRALRDVPRDEPCLLFLISATPTAMFAAAMIDRISRRVAGVQIGLHGNLSDIFAWRSRNPLVRAFDLRSAMSGRHSGHLRYLVLEEAIRRELLRVMPEAARVTDVLPHPVIQAERDCVIPVPYHLPLRIGLVGQATEAKGVTPFLELARKLKARHGDKVCFEVIGRAPPGSDLARFAVLDEPVTHEHLSRAAFRARLAQLHYVCLPFQTGYYNLSASGAFIDAVTWLKPIIACRVPIVEDAFTCFGELGHLCHDASEMCDLVEGLVTQPDPGRYAAQVEALRQAREVRTPDALARDYRGIVARGFPRLLASAQATSAPSVLRIGTSG
jgi:hypothetical protein